MAYLFSRSSAVLCSISSPAYSTAKSPLKITNFIINISKVYIAGPSSGGGWGASAPPNFDRSVNPISTRGADYAHHSTTSPPGFSDLATGLMYMHLRDVTTGKM